MNTERQTKDHTSQLQKYQKYFLVPAVFIILIIVVAHQMASADILQVGTLLVAVTDAHNGSSLDGAAVYVDGGYEGATSDADGAGTMNISNIKQGTQHPASDQYRLPAIFRNIYVSQWTGDPHKPVRQPACRSDPGK